MVSVGRGRTELVCKGRTESVWVCPLIPGMRRAAEMHLANSYGLGPWLKHKVRRYAGGCNRPVSGFLAE